MSFQNCVYASESKEHDGENNQHIYEIVKCNLLTNIMSLAQFMSVSSMSVDLKLLF
jgi:hypothetical protein